MTVRKTAVFLLLLLLCLALSGCRTRTAGTGGTGPDKESGLSGTASASLPDDRAEEQNPGDKQNGEPGSRTREHPEASRKEYDENAPAEMVPGTERTVHGAGEGGGASAADEDARETADRLNDGAEDTVSRTVPAEQAEQMGVSEDGKQADSAMTYYTVLLQDRLGGLFECQRLTVYWETAEDRVTVFKTSPEHQLILNAGAYDVSARLLEENLHVDDGWIGRKNPGVIVKAVGSGVLGTGVSSADAAKKIYAALQARDGWSGIDAVRSGRVLLLSGELLEAPHLQVAAMLAVAKTAYPALMEDVDMTKALAMLAEEAAGSIPSGIYWYSGTDSF